MDEFSYNSAITACRRGSTWRSVFGLVLAMETRLLEPDAFTWTAVVSACESQWEAAMGCKCSTDSTLPGHNAILSACAKSSEWLQALSHLNRLGHLPVSTDIISWNVMILGSFSGRKSSAHSMNMGVS